MQALQKIKIVVAGGGTGGHVFPGIAILKALERHAPIDVLWIGTGRPVEQTALQDTGYNLKVLSVKPLKGRSPSAILKALFGLPISILKAAILLLKFRPNVVLGVGGYVAGPVLMAAKGLHIPTAIHEQNMIPGLANKLAAKFVDKIFVSFPGSEKYFPKKEVIVTGNPIRSDLLEQAAVSPPASTNSKRILVLGGSQGARGINEMVTSALISIWNSGQKISVLHQTGQTDFEWVRTKYDEAGVPAQVKPFLHNMGAHLGWADLVIARAGAGTVSELAAVGKPSLLIPYPHAASGHQDANAEYLASQGAALVFKEGETGAVKLASAIQALLDDPDKLQDMAERAKTLGRVDSADVIAKELLDLLKKKAKKQIVPLRIKQGLKKSHV